MRVVSIVLLDVCGGGDLYSMELLSAFIKCKQGSDVWSLDNYHELMRLVLSTPMI